MAPHVVVLRGHEAESVPAHRAFDPRLVGHLEAAAWVAYYRRRWFSFLWAAVLLTRHTFGLPWPRTLLGAWLVLRANQLWAPFPTNDPAGARRAMERFYTLVKQRYHEPFEPAVAARLEVEWWRVHREHQHPDSSRDHGPLTQGLAELYAYVYGISEASVQVAAEQRAVAMDHSDRWVREGCDSASALIPLERAALVRSYAALLAVVHNV